MDRNMDGASLRAVAIAAGYTRTVYACLAPVTKLGCGALQTSRPATPRLQRDCQRWPPVRSALLRLPSYASVIFTRALHATAALCTLAAWHDRGVCLMGAE